MNILEKITLNDVKNIGLKSISCETAIYPTQENNMTACVNITMSGDNSKFSYTGQANRVTANSDDPQTIIDVASKNAISRASILARNLTYQSSSDSISNSENTDRASIKETQCKAFAEAPSSNSRPQNRHSKSKPISDGQKSFLHKLAREKASSADSLARKKFGTSVDDLSSWQCQEILNDLKYGS